MPLLVPLALIGVAMLSVIALYEYEQLFGSPLQGLANNVPVVGGWIASGVKAAVAFGKAALYDWTSDAFDTIADWLNALADRLIDFPAAVDATIHQLVDGIDHLTHTTVHEIVKSFVKPVHDLAGKAEADAIAAAQSIKTLSDDVGHALNDSTGILHRAIHDAVAGIENVDLPALQHSLRGEIATAAGTVAGDVDALHDWASGWIDSLLHDYQQIPLVDLIAALGTLAALQTLVGTIAAESGLDNPGCRGKVKNICSTDPRGWEQLLGIAVPLFALPGLGLLVEAAGSLLHLAEPVLADIHT